MRGVLCALAACLAFQAVAAPAQRALARAHHHRGVAGNVGPTVAPALGALYAPAAVGGREGEEAEHDHSDARESVSEHDAHGHEHKHEHQHQHHHDDGDDDDDEANAEPTGVATPPGHDHAGTARHEHDATDPSVVYAAEDGQVPSQGPVAAPTRPVFDLDALPPPPAPRLAGALMRVAWAQAEGQRIDNHITSPPERPPRG